MDAEGTYWRKRVHAEQARIAALPPHETAGEIIDFVKNRNASDIPNKAEAIATLWRSLSLSETERTIIETLIEIETAHEVSLALDRD